MTSVTMRVVELQTPGEPPAVVARPDPVPGPGEVLVRLAAAPITPQRAKTAPMSSSLPAPPSTLIGIETVARIRSASSRS